MGRIGRSIGRLWVLALGAGWVAASAGLPVPLSSAQAREVVVPVTGRPESTNPTPPAPPPAATDEAAEVQRRALLRDFLVRAVEAYGKPPPLLPGQPPLDGLPPQAINDIPDGEELLLSVLLGSQRIAEGLLGVKRGETVHLHLGELAASLEFPITVDGAGVAEGWFVAEDRRFRLDPAAGTVAVAGLMETIPPGSLSGSGLDLLVDARLLDRWFGIGMRLDLREQALHLSPKAPLPMQARLARRERGKPDTSPGMAAPTAPPVAREYRPLGWPFVDLSLLAQAERTGADGTRGIGQFSAVGGGDLGFARSSFVFSADEDGVETARIALGRQDPEGGLLGPLGATGWEVGEVLSTRLPVAGAAVFERGLRVGNQPLGSSDRFDRTDIVGDLPPGWDVELYRNGALVGFNTVGGEGRYEFRDVPVFLGVNDFRLVYYGPQGQIREEARSVPVGLGLAAPGQLLYDLSLTERATPLFPRGNRSGLGGGPRLVATGTYGVVDGLSVNSGVEANSFGGERFLAVQGGAVLRVDGALASLGVAGDTDGGRAAELVAQARVLDHDVRLRGQWLDGLGVGAGVPGREGLQGELVVRGNAARFLARPGSYELLADYREENNGRRTARLGARLSASIGTGSVAQALLVEDQRRSPEAGRSVEGTTQLSTAIGPVRLRGLAEYRLTPDPTLLNTSLSGSVSLGSGVRAELGVVRSEESDLTSGILRATWTTDWGVVGPVVSYDSDRRLTAGVQFSTAVAREPRGGAIHLSSQRLGNSGGVSARVFLDRDGDGSFGPGDQPIPNALVSAPQAYRSAITDDQGIAFLIGLAENIPTDVLLDPGTLDDPYWVPVIRGLSVVPRLGVVHDLDFPVTIGGEVDGTVLQIQADGRQGPARRVEMRLVRPDGTVQDRQETAFDGFFLFTGVPPGQYRLEVAEAALEKTGTPLRYGRTITIPPDGDTVTVADIQLGAGAAGALARADARFGVEVGRYNSRFGALADLITLYASAPDLAGRLTLVEDAGAPGAAPTPRLAAADLGDLSEAEQACRRLRSAARPCRVVAVISGA